MEFDTEDDDNEDNQLKWANKHITVVNRYDLITRYLLDQRFVTKKREAWLIQGAVIVFFITVYVFWSIVF